MYGVQNLIWRKQIWLNYCVIICVWLYFIAICLRWVLLSKLSSFGLNESLNHCIHKTKHMVILRSNWLSFMKINLTIWENRKNKKVCKIEFLWKWSDESKCVAFPWNLHLVSYFKYVWWVMHLSGIPYYLGVLFSFVC